MRFNKIILSSLFLYIMISIAYLSFSEYFLKHKIDQNFQQRLHSSELIVRSYITDYLLSAQYFYSKQADYMFKNQTILKHIKNKEFKSLRKTMKPYFEKIKVSNRSLMDIHIYFPTHHKYFEFLKKEEHMHGESFKNHSQYIQTIQELTSTYVIEDDTYIFSVAKPLFSQEEKVIAVVEYVINMEYLNNIIKDRFSYDLALIDTKQNKIYGSTSEYLTNLLTSNIKRGKIYKQQNSYKNLFFMKLGKNEKLAILFDITKVLKSKQRFLEDINKFTFSFFMIGSLLWIVITFIIIQLVKSQNDLIENLDKKVDEKTKYINSLLKLFDKNVISSRTDLKGKITYASEAYQKISGFSQEELLGKSHNIARHPEVPKSFFEDMWQTIKKEKIWNGEILNLTKEGEPYWLKASIEPYYENGIHVGYNSTREDIRAKKELEELNKNLEEKVKERTLELEKQLYIDNLTKLGSYHALSEDINICATSFPVLMLINIDNFQNINNLYGYEVGNDILKEFAVTLNSFVENGKYKIYRLYADEFVLFQNCQYHDIEEYHQDLLTLKALIQDHKFYIKSINEYINLDITIGVSMGQENPIGTVDMALRYAKKHKLSFQTYHQDLNSEYDLKNTLYWKNIIKEAIKENRVIPVFQPIVDRDEKIIKYEVLTRIQEKDDPSKLIAPYKFLEEAINAKQYNNIMKIIFDKTFTVIENSERLFAINISYTDIFNNTLVQYLEDKIKDNRKIAARIVLEILETDEIEDSELMDKFIKKFKSYGVKIAIDDFGVGHSNLSHIYKVHPDYLKIDGEFIKNINEDEQSFAIVSSIVVFCKKLNIKVVAEYVHSREIFDTLYKLGIDEFQGYYFSPPKEKIN